MVTKVNKNTYTTERRKKIADFSKTGSRNMAETCSIDFSDPTYYSSSIVLEGLRGSLLPVLTWSCVDLENCCNCSFERYGGGLLGFFSYLVGETQQWTWLLQWIVLCDHAPQCCCLWRGPISRQQIVVVADNNRNDEPLCDNGGTRTPISPRFAVFRVFAIFERPWEKKSKS